MKSNKRTEIGIVESISSNSVNIRLLDDIKSNMQIIGGSLYRIGLIGSFVRIPLGYANLYGIVTKVGAAARPEAMNNRQDNDYSLLENQQWISAVLIGEQKGKKFDRGVTQYPTTGDVVHLVTNDDLKIVYGTHDDANSLKIGTISGSENLDAVLNLDKLIARHCAVLGSTGSGKSNAVSIIVNSIVEKNFESARILVIDPHGEYEHVFQSNCRVLQINSGQSERKLKVPYWCLQFEQLLKVIGLTLPEQNRDYVREKILAAKLCYCRSNSLNVTEQSISADSPIPYDIKQVWYEIDRFERITYRRDRVTEDIISEGSTIDLMSAEFRPAGIGGAEPYMNSSRKGLLTFCELLRNRIIDNRYGFLFQPDEYMVNDDTCTSDIDKLLLSWIGGEQPITVLDLSGIPPEITQTILGTVLSIINDAVFWGQNLAIGGKRQPLFVVLEEAHLYLKSGENSIASDVLHSIAKEGRKYGIGLMLSTQRASELDETVLSQCGTIIALRMNNDRDKGCIKSAIQDQLHSMIDMLSSIKIGEALISGEAVSIPARIKFFKADNAPKSTDPEASVKWKLKISDKEEKYRELGEKWRKQKL